jgi:TorA maturation chaperone TorD
MEMTETLESPAEMAGAWLFVHDLFRSPDERQWEWLSSSDVLAARRRLGEALGVKPPEEWPASPRSYESEFIAAFDAGAPTPLIPLLESHYNKREPVPKILHENILFYSAFGLKLKDSAAETADHLRYQLEFVGYLYRLESRGDCEPDRSSGPSQPGQLATARADADSLAHGCSQIRAARRDYVSRHLLSWLPAACHKAANAPFGWAREHLGLARALAEHELRMSARHLC